MTDLYYNLQPTRREVIDRIDALRAQLSKGSDPEILRRLAELEKGQAYLKGALTKIRNVVKKLVDDAV